MEWQHCIACCGVAATQSTAYAARAIVSAATIPGLAKPIPIRLEGLGLLSQAGDLKLECNIELQFWRIGGGMKHVRVGLSIMAAIFTAAFAQEVVMMLRYVSAEKATGLMAVAGGLAESFLSPIFWLSAILLFVLFFAASRLGSKSLRILFFWVPSVATSILGLSVAALFAYFWIHLRRA